MMTLKQLPPASGLITRWSGPLGDIFRLQRQVEVTEVEQKKWRVTNHYRSYLRFYNVSILFETSI